MNVFLDTSALFKLYHQEADSKDIEDVFINNFVQAVFLSELSKLEFASAVWKKVRTKDLDVGQAQVLLANFAQGFGKYVFIQMDNIVVEKARALLNAYGTKGLRTLDSIQLATAPLLKSQIGIAKSADTFLKELLQLEGLVV